MVTKISITTGDLLIPERKGRNKVGSIILQDGKNEPKMRGGRIGE